MKNNKISKAGFLLAVSNMAKARSFYETVMEQKALNEFGDDTIEYESGFALQLNYAGILAGTKDFAPHPTGAKLEVKPKSNSCQLAFEVEDLDYWVERIKSTEGIELVHDVAVYNWGQRVIRFYDYDGHIVELGEDLAVVVKRFLAQGLSVEEIVERFEVPLEFIQELLSAE